MHQVATARVLVELENVADALLDARFVLDFLMGAVVDDDALRARVFDIKGMVVSANKQVETLVAGLKQAEKDAEDLPL